ncbi:MAG: polynucleotide adenylyltransferase PcnB [Planctomycetota bacterium]
MTHRSEEVGASRDPRGGRAIDRKSPSRRPKIVPRAEHNISRRDIDPDALKILYRLNRHRYKAYLVGGGVRDLQLGVKPKDFDIATDARPGRLKKMFRNCRIIGRRFRLAHIHYPGDKIIEVATFRSSGESDAIVRDGDLIRRDNVFGTPQEDALRRDITINALFYDISDFSVIDYLGGMADLREGLIRTIAPPEVSFREDPVRMLRVIRHATRLGFRIEEGARRALVEERDEILKANQARLLEEFYKDLTCGRARAYFESLHEHQFLRILVPSLVETFRRRGPRTGKKLFLESLDRLDALVVGGREVSHAIALAALFSPMILPVARALEQGGPGPGSTVVECFQEALGPAFRHLKVYRRDEERLWHVLGAWLRVRRAFERGSIPAALAKRHYFPDAAETLGIIEEMTPELESFLTEVRALPPPESQAIDGQGRRRRRRRKRAPGAERPAEPARARNSAREPERRKRQARSQKARRRRRHRRGAAGES